MNRELLQKYATFAVRVAAGLKPGQNLLINSSVQASYFAVMCAKEGYAAGARDVVVNYSDDRLLRMKMENCSIDTLTDIKPYIERMRLDYIEGEGGAVLLNIIGDDPELLKGIDIDKIDARSRAISLASENIRNYTMNDRVQWTIVAVPNEAWNKKVFPNLSAEEAEEKMWENIFLCTRVAGGKPVEEWEEYIDKTVARREKLNALRLHSIRMSAANGTNLTVGLADDHVWDGGLSVTPEGNRFIANVPTEEIFTAPHRARVDGIAYSSKPYVFNGALIEDFWFKFQDGEVVEYSAKVGNELLEKLLTGDEHCKRIGEIALVDKHSGVGRSNTLYYNTLYDENAACHIAFGKAYPTCVAGGEKLSKEELLEKGVNDSIYHQDVMIGTNDMDIVGIHKDGSEISLFVNGEWVI